MNAYNCIFPRPLNNQTLFNSFKNYPSARLLAVDVSAKLIKGKAIVFYRVEIHGLLSRSCSPHSPQSSYKYPPHTIFLR